ncbi:NAD(P)/FAD-dependent oxidoreductase [Konateibacter massiliensis]|uniref:NAD(P)/FAD-dependent oxidoreductase n=1 Tax=Konateibacter massiliensis TaxID=2002841 RepID=UPI000C15D573|nr:FAD-dependent oxidoreductase [Konateibacter massiliensis]
MIRIQQLKLNPGHTEEELIKKLSKQLRCSAEEIKQYNIVKQSIDARKKNEIKFIYTVDVSVDKEKEVMKKLRDPNISLAEEKKYVFPRKNKAAEGKRPVIVGSGPAGLFCGLLLAENGFCPLVLEQGECVEDRVKTVEEFWENGILNTSSNVQFGEGGAGTFSDGKLNTLVKDISGRNKKVLETFVEAGAPKEILYMNKPHIGTDILAEVVKNIREKIIAYGGEVRFGSKVTDIRIEKGRISKVIVNESEEIETDRLVLAIGHSARDTFEMLLVREIEMSAKAFAVGVRIQHPQEMMNEAQYGVKSHPHLPNAEYKLAKTLENGRGVYSFCMCPGGYVVNASSEQDRLAVNGMSYSKRDGKNANSAIIVSVNPSDFSSDGPLAGLEFQRQLEERSYEEGKGAVPIQLYEDFRANRESVKLGDVEPQIKGEYRLSNLRNIFPEFLSESLIQGIDSFERNIRDFNRADAVLAGVESRTSSPVRITRGETLECNIAGIYPCGEGAGYAGGITSAAMDGIKVAEAIALEND